QLPIETVLTPETMVVKATVDRNNLGKLKTGKEIKIENLAGKQFKGRVGKISPDEERGNVEILIEEEKEARGLRTGPTEIAIVLSEQEKIPKVQAMIESETKYFVMLDKKESSKSKSKKDKKSKTKGVKTQIQVGEHNETHYEILSGVKEGDRVFVQSIGELVKKK
ncbi:MAG: hypothetical protein ACE5PV_11845, partial [Candidatus Poribacteria bacterium]